MAYLELVLEPISMLTGNSKSRDDFGAETKWIKAKKDGKYDIGIQDNTLTPEIYFKFRHHNIVKRLTRYSISEKINFIEYQLDISPDPLVWLECLQKLIIDRSGSQKRKHLEYFSDKEAIILTEIVVGLETKLREDLHKKIVERMIHKIQTSFNVADLSVFLNLNMEVKNFTEHQAKIYRMAPYIFACSTTDSPSQNTLKNSWNNLNLKTIRKWKTILNKCFTILTDKEKVIRRKQKKNNKL